MQEHGASVLRLAFSLTKSRVDAEDVYQDVFVSLACSDTDFLDDEHLHAWLLRVTLNRCRDLMRSWWKRRTQPLGDCDMLVGAAEDQEQDGPSDRELWDAVEQLPERYRAVVHLRYVEDMSAEEIATVCGISESTVRTRLSRAHQKLRVYLGGVRD